MDMTVLTVVGLALVAFGLVSRPEERRNAADGLLAAGVDGRQEGISLSGDPTVCATTQDHRRTSIARRTPTADRDAGLLHGGAR